MPHKSEKDFEEAKNIYDIWTAESGIDKYIFIENCIIPKLDYIQGFIEETRTKKYGSVGKYILYLKNVKENYCIWLKRRAKNRYHQGKAYEKRNRRHCIYCKKIHFQKDHYKNG